MRIKSPYTITKMESPRKRLLESVACSFLRFLMYRANNRASRPTMIVPPPLKTGLKLVK